MTNSFTQTSAEPYDAHTYEIVLKNGKKVFFEYWEDAQGYWFGHSQIPDYLDVINVKDKQKPKNKGFGK